MFMNKNNVIHKRARLNGITNKELENIKFKGSVKEFFKVYLVGNKFFSKKDNAIEYLKQLNNGILPFETIVETKNDDMTIMLTVRGL